MIKIENWEVIGWEHAIRGMRNPKNSWKKSDSVYWDNDTDIGNIAGFESTVTNRYYDFYIGPNDHKLMMNLASGGPVHAKYRRMITVYVDITAPLYWWKEFDTYKVGTVANSCSTMHKIHAKEFTWDDFSHEHLTNFGGGGEPRYSYAKVMGDVIESLNGARELYLDYKSRGKDFEIASKQFWWQMIQLLPSSYNQKRTIMLNYEVLVGIYKWRKDHKLDEWRDFCKWIESLPYSELITGERNDD